MNKSLIANDLLPVYQTTDSGERVIDGRELHGFLNVGRDFTTWMKDRVQKYGFKEGEDFAITLTKTGERQNVNQHAYILKLDMAKELAMVENNEQGRKARRYFIEVEKRFKDTPAIPLATSNTQPFPELESIAKLMQMLRLGIRDNLFDAASEQALRVRIAEMVTGKKEPVIKALPHHVRPEPQHTSYSGRWYSTTEISVIAGVSKRLISVLASRHNVRVPEFSREYSEKIHVRTGWVEIQYNEAGKDRLVQLANDRIAEGYIPRPKTIRKTKR